MPSILHVSAHLSQDELVDRFKRCRDVGERLRWQAVMLKAEGRSARDIADICKRREDWVRRTVRAYNAGGPDALVDGREDNGREPILDEALRGQLAAALRKLPADGGFWTARKVAKWIEAAVGTAVSEDTGRLYMVRAGMTRQVPRPRHPEADAEAQEAFKKGGSRAVFETSFETILAQKSRSGRKTRPALD